MTDPKIPPRIIGGRVYHKPRGKPYAYGATAEAIARAARKGYDGIDLDHRTNLQHQGWCFHQANPTKRDGWTDPRGEINDNTPVVTMSNTECARLHYQGHSSLSVLEALLLCKKHKLIPCFEDKTFRGEPAAYWATVKGMADEIGVTAIVMSLPGANSVPGARKLKAAHDAGLVTMWLWRRGSKIPPFVDLVKSHRGRPIYRVSETPVAGPATPPRDKPWGTRRQIRALRRLERIARPGGRRLRPFQRRRLRRLRALKRRNQ